MKVSMKKHAGELRSLGRTGNSEKVSVEEAEAIYSKNSDAFAAAGIKRRNRIRSSSDSEVN